VLASFRPLGAALEWKGVLYGFSMASHMASPWLFLSETAELYKAPARQLEQNGLIRENM